MMRQIMFSKDYHKNFYHPTCPRTLWLPSRARLYISFLWIWTGLLLSCHQENAEDMKLQDMRSGQKIWRCALEPRAAMLWGSPMRSFEKPNGEVPKSQLWILIIYRFCICKFAYSLKFPCNTKSILAAHWSSSVNMCRVANNLSLPICMLLAEGKQVTLCLLISALML